MFMSRIIHLDLNIHVKAQEIFINSDQTSISSITNTDLNIRVKIVNSEVNVHVKDYNFRS